MRGLILCQGSACAAPLELYLISELTGHVPQQLHSQGPEALIEVARVQKAADPPPRQTRLARAGDPGVQPSISHLRRAQAAGVKICNPFIFKTGGVIPYIYSTHIDGHLFDCFQLSSPHDTQNHVPCTLLPRSFTTLRG